MDKFPFPLMSIFSLEIKADALLAPYKKFPACFGGQKHCSKFINNSSRDGGISIVWIFRVGKTFCDKHQKKLYPSFFEKPGILLSFKKQVGKTKLKQNQNTQSEKTERVSVLSLGAKNKKQNELTYRNAKKYLKKIVC